MILSGPEGWEGQKIREAQHEIFNARACECFASDTSIFYRAGQTSAGLNMIFLIDEFFGVLSKCLCESQQALRIHFLDLDEIGRILVT